MSKTNNNRELDHLLVTSDAHFGHANIIPYCGRPWLQPGDYIWEPQVPGQRSRGHWASKVIKEQRAREMSADLTANWNSVANPGDTIYHIGDWCLSRWDGMSAYDWEKQLNGTVVHIVGNHDRTNGVRGLTCGVLEVMGHSCFLIHEPPHRAEEIPDFCDIVLCGHVHEKWDHRWVEDRLLLNVGVDVRGFKPWPLRDAIIEAERLQSDSKSLSTKSF